MKHNTFGIIGSDESMGNGTLAVYFPNAVVRRNVLAGGKASIYPPDNFFPDVATFWAQFVNYSAGNYALVSGSPFVNRGTDGKNIGVDFVALGAAQAGSSTPTTSNAAPTANAGGPYTGLAGASIAFDGRGSRDSNGTIASYRWEWGDGTSAGSGATPTHTYATAGTYSVRLTVTDDAGTTGTATTTATVKQLKTVTLSAADGTLTDDVTIRGGGYASVNFSTDDTLATKKSPDISYMRRILLKFDTASRIPSGATISRAELVLTLKSAGATTTRPIAVYRVTKSFLEGSANWLDYRSGSRWTTAGGDLAEQWGTVNVGQAAGAVVRFDITSFVRQSLIGTFGTRFTRFALVDVGAAHNESMRVFHSSRTATASVRPKLIVSYY
jgi:chitodextrinase